jgi:3-methyl-2-oxobutanoate hydroxymethyltransferase
VVVEALALEQAGDCALVLESIPAEGAGRVTTQLRIPTIGIGAGPDCDGQVLVSYDMLGLFGDAPPFVKRYARLGDTLIAAAREYADDVRTGAYGRTSPAGAVRTP